MLILIPSKAEVCMWGIGNLGERAYFEFSWFAAFANLLPAFHAWDYPRAYEMHVTASLLRLYIPGCFQLHCYLHAIILILSGFDNLRICEIACSVEMMGAENATSDAQIPVQNF